MGQPPPSVVSDGRAAAESVAEWKRDPEAGAGREGRRAAGARNGAAREWRATGLGGEGNGRPLPHALLNSPGTVSPAIFDWCSFRGIVRPPMTSATCAKTAFGREGGEGRRRRWRGSGEARHRRRKEVDGIDCGGVAESGLACATKPLSTRKKWFELNPPSFATSRMWATVTGATSG